MFNWVCLPRDAAEKLGRLIHEMESKGTLGGEDLPDAQSLELDDWYSKVGEQILKVLLK